MALTMSRENYLKIIYILKKANGEVRSIDIANYMELSKPSVCAAVKQLQAQGYITKDGNGIIELTESGRAEAREALLLRGKADCRRRFPGTGACGCRQAGACGQ